MVALLYTALAATAVVQALLMLLRGYENARHFRSGRRSPAPTDFAPRVELFVPAKGVDAEFDQLVAAILAQDYPRYAVTFVVESRDDPAYPRLQRLLRGSHPAPARVVVAGPGYDCGQKVHNLLAATARLDPSVEVLAFVDSDTRLAANWLRQLVAPLGRPGVGAATGYRWCVPKAADWPGAVLSALNGAVASLLGNHGWNMVWGGSWAIRRATFDALGVRRAWQGTLSDDYVVTRVVRRAGLRVAFAPACLVASPVATSWGGLGEFARRQYLITRVYHPGLWWLAVGVRLLSAVAFWGGLGLAAGRWWAGQPVWPVAAFPAALYALGSLRAVLRQTATRAAWPDARPALRRAARLDVFAQPVLGLIDLLLLLSAAVGRQITWRGIGYRLESARRTRILFRPAVAHPVAKAA